MCVVFERLSVRKFALAVLCLGACIVVSGCSLCACVCVCVVLCCSCVCEFVCSFIVLCVCGLFL